MDKASFTIDRHTPVIPESIWCGLTPDTEAIYTSLKNKVILPTLSVHKPSRIDVESDKHPRTITSKMLDDAHKATQKVAGKFSDEHLEYLFKRKITIEEISRYEMCSTGLLVSLLSPETVINLTLELPPKLSKYVSSLDIDGISVPCYYGGLFCGFVTRILNHKRVKYAFSVPHRCCFGVDFSNPEIYVVEGLFDAIAMHKLGYNTMGMGDSQPNYFKMLTAAKFEKINLLFDDDYAGWLGAVKAYTILTVMCGKSPDQIEILSLDGGHDPETAISFGNIKWNKVTIVEAVEKTNKWAQHHAR